MPLSGRRVLVTRQEPPEGKLTQLLKQHHATVLHLPTLALTAPESWDAFDAAAARLTEVDWIAFTSPSAVHWTFSRLRDLQQVLPPTCSLAVVGSETGHALAAEGHTPTLTPDQFAGASLADALHAAATPGTCWLPRSTQALPHLPDALRAQGFTVWSTPAYANHPRIPIRQELTSLFEEGLDWVTFASPSAVQAFFASDYFQRSPVPPLRSACIGETTAQALREQGELPQAIGNPQTLAGMVSAMVRAERRA